MSVDVDLIIMSKASDPQLAAMTQRAIDSAVENDETPLHVYVMEQCEGVEYQCATTIPNPGPFNYNAACNKGAKQGWSAWIVFANNDLRFERGWATALLRASHPVMSPYNPRYYRHHNCLYDESGWQVGRHLSGWCYMMMRCLWEDLGGLDETYPFWCSDNAVMDQLRAKDIQPVLVRGSVVHHNVSMTLSQEDAATQDTLTWAAVHAYNQVAEHPACGGDFRYEAWKQRNEIV